MDYSSMATTVMFTDPLVNPRSNGNGVGPDDKSQILIQSVSVEPVKPPAQKKAPRPELLKSRSKVDFGETFLKRNKNADFKPECTVTIHDYSNDRYEINGVDAARKPSSLPFSDFESMEKQYPTLTTGRPEWANVRYAGCRRFDFTAVLTKSN
jgi:hypothetical protein